MNPVKQVYGCLNQESLLTCRLVSHGMNKEATDCIATNPKLLSLACEKMLQEGSEAAVAEFVATFGGVTTPLTLKLDTTKTITSQKTIDLLAQYFPNIQRVEFHRRGPYQEPSWPRDFDCYPQLPPSVTEVEIDDEQLLDLNHVCGKLKTLKQLALKRYNKELEEEVIGFEFPKTLTKLDFCIFQPTLKNKSQETALALYTRALIAKKRVESIPLLERCIELLPHFNLAKLQLAYNLTDTFRSVILLREVLKDDPEDPVALLLLSNHFRKVGETTQADEYYNCACQIAIEKNDYTALINLAQNSRSKELVERAYQMIDRSIPKVQLVTYLKTLIAVDPTHVYAHIELSLFDHTYCSKAEELCQGQQELAPFITFTTLFNPSQKTVEEMAKLCKKDVTNKNFRTLLELQRKLALADWLTIFRTLKQNPEPYIRFEFYFLMHTRQNNLLKDAAQYLKEQSLYPELQLIAETFLRSNA